MRTQIKYEWTIELIDEDGDIIDSDFADKKKDLSGMDMKPDQRIDIGLVRNEGNEIDGVSERYWAYIKDGVLPEYFTNANSQQTNIKVPIKFHKELLLVS